MADTISRKPQQKHPQAPMIRMILHIGWRQRFSGLPPRAPFSSSSRQFLYHVSF